MIISRTPFRVSLFGGGSDYPDWYMRHGGEVIGMAINKYCYLSVRHLPPFFDHKYRISYSKVELVNEISAIEHPSVRAVLTESGIQGGLVISHDGDLPARSGLGSSSTFTVGLLNAVNSLMHRQVDEHMLASEAIRIEQKVIREHVGSQDQVWAAYGGFRRITFNQDGSFIVAHVPLTLERQNALIGNLLLYFTGLSRYATVIAQKKIANLNAKEAHIRSMRDMVGKAQDIIGNVRAPLNDIGKMLHESWLMKRDLADGVTTPEIDDIYNAAKDAGAVGGKVLGAGGGGFMLFYVEPENRAKVMERLKHLIRVDFNVASQGSRIVVYEPSGLENC